MPLYDYECKTCDLMFEVSRSFKDADLGADCPTCFEPAKRVLSAPMTYTKGAALSALNANSGGATAGAASRWSHFGHSHGTSASSHSHGGGSSGGGGKAAASPAPKASE
jgi:putative FmdB family regulatory protein